MSKGYWLRQCKLKKDDQYQTAWIPEKFAIIDKYIKINGENHWRVDKIYSRKHSTKLLSRIRDYKNHRKATDI